MAIAHRSTIRAGALALLLLVAVGPPSYGQYAFSIVSRPEKAEIFYGVAIDWTVKDENHLYDVTSVSWEQWGECTQQWYPLAPGIQHPIIEATVVGLLKIRARVTVDSDPPHTFMLPWEAEIPPPDEVRHVEGQKVPAAPWDTSRQVFRIWSKGHQIGYAEGWPQEKITGAFNLVTRKKFFHTKDTDPDLDGWVPDGSDLPTIYFEEGGTKIVDICGAFDPWFDRYPVGPFFVHNQQWRIKCRHYGHCRDNNIKGTPAMTPTFRRTWIKQADGNWHIDTK
jgi:hypothetical protein